MARPLPHSDRKGINAALDLVETAIASLQERVQQQQSQEVTHASATIPPVSGSHSSKSTNSRRTNVPRPPRKETSVLVKRNSRGSTGRYKSQHNTHADRHAKPQKKRDATKRPDRNEKAVKRDTRTNSCHSDGAEKVHSGDSKAHPHRHKDEQSSHVRKRSYREQSTSDDTSPDVSVKGRKHRSSKKHGEASHPKRQGEASHPKNKSNLNKSGGKAAVSKNFAQATLTTRLRGQLSTQEKSVKENIIPFIPCVSKGKSHHLGVLMQEQLGLFNTMPFNQHPNLSPSPSHHTPSLSKSQTVSSSQSRLTAPPHATPCSECGHGENKSRGQVSGEREGEVVSEELVRRALANLHYHLGQSASHTHRC